jgi:hypothetical protein
MQWTSRDDRGRYVAHGAEWYVFRDGLISEIRAYYSYGRNEDTGLVDFPYAKRGYMVVVERRGTRTRRTRPASPPTCRGLKGRRTPHQPAASGLRSTLCVAT